MLADLQLDIARKNQPHMTLAVCWHQMLFLDQIMMTANLTILKLRGCRNVYDYQKERSLKTLCIS